MTEAGLDPRRISITPLDPEKHNRASFSCGTIRLDNFLKRSARKHQSGDFTRVWVATEDGWDEILGYYALNAHSLKVRPPAQPDETRTPVRKYPHSLPLDDRRRTVRHQGRGIGRILLIDAMTRVAAARRPNRTESRGARRD